MALDIPIQMNGLRTETSLSSALPFLDERGNLPTRTGLEGQSLQNSAEGFLGVMGRKFTSGAPKQWPSPAVVAVAYLRAS